MQVARPAPRKSPRWNGSITRGPWVSRARKTTDRISLGPARQHAPLQRVLAAVAAKNNQLCPFLTKSFDNTYEDTSQIPSHQSHRNEEVRECPAHCRRPRKQSCRAG